MQRREFVIYVARHSFVLALGGAACSTSGCGTFIHAERRGQPHSHQIDWKIAALDSLGLLLFFVPGVVAFVVDFWTGAIYLPIEQAYPGYGACGEVPAGPPVVAPSYPMAPGAAAVPPAAPAAGRPELGLKRLELPRDQLVPRRIERVVAEHIGQLVSLDDPQARLSALARVDQFDEQASRHRDDQSFGFEVRSYFERLLRA